jgi:2-polyprenyl-3-methyl-5-hydroxy-6-metoxy-1,4-benzoquinol methylase
MNTTETVLCRACGAVLSSKDIKQTLSRQAATEIEYNRYQCPVCTFEFWFPMDLPSVDFYRAMYANFTWLDEDPRSDDPGYFKRFVSVRGGKILDVGCGHGAFLREMPELGFEVWGTDIIPEAVAKIRKLFGFEHIYALPFFEFAKQKDLPTFDVITTFNVLEHSGDPQLFFEGASKLLKPGGLLVFSVPDATTYTAWQQLHNIPPNQFSWWNKRAIEAILKRHGFELEAVHSVGWMHPIDVVMGAAVRWFGYSKQINFRNQDQVTSNEWRYKEKKTLRGFARLLIKKAVSLFDPVSKALSALGLGRNHYFVVARKNIPVK